MSKAGGNTMKAWRTHEYGEPLSVLKLDEVDVPAPGEGEVRVRVEAIPLNLNDLERIKGGNKMVNPELPYSPGMEVMGVVDACGPGAAAWQDKRVVAIPAGAFGGYAEYAICPTVSAFEMPEDIPLPDAAALYFPFHLAWLGLYDRAKVAAGETVLIHAAAGGAGSAAIQLAKNAGARVVGTAGTEEKLQLCRDLGADLAINYSEGDFSRAVLDYTDGKGADVVFDNVGEAVMEQSMNCLAYNGRYVMMGFASDKQYADQPFIVPRRVALGNCMICGVMLAYVPDDKAKELKAAMGWNFATESMGADIQGKLVELYRQGKIRAVVGQSIRFEEIPEAIDAMAKRKTVGRTIAMFRGE